MSTWYDIKLTTLQKMFGADAQIVNDESTIGYLSAMPFVANEVLQLLSTAGKFVIKSFNIVHAPVKNIIPDSVSKQITQIIDGTTVYEGYGAKSYYFEVCGKGSYTVIIDGVEGAPIDIVDSTKYNTFKGLIPNFEAKNVQIKFSSVFPMSIRNVALYEATYETDEEVPIFREKIPYRISEYVDDFYMIDPQGIYFEGDYSTYLNTSDFYQEADRIILLDREMVGSYTVYYKAYPPQITADTEDDYELPLDPEVLPLMPLYMASQLYKDDDNGIATSYRNEFEVAFERLRNSVNKATKEEFVSESGWI